MINRLTVWMETGRSWNVTRGQQTLHSLDGNWNELDVARGQQTLHSLDGNWNKLDRGTWSTDFAVWVETGILEYGNIQSDT